MYQPSTRNQYFGGLLIVRLTVTGPPSTPNWGVIVPGEE